MNARASLWCCIVFGVVLACGSTARLGSDAASGPSLVMPARFAEGRTGKPITPPSADAGVPDAGKEHRAESTPPDPPPLVTQTQWLYRFEYRKGAIKVASVEKKDFDRPVPTDRRVGRFAVELWVGRELLDRVRFDFPLLAADPAPPGTRRPLRAAAPFGPGAETSREVLVPASDRATRAVLVDRLNGHSMPLPWPPEAPAQNAAEPVK